MVRTASRVVWDWQVYNSERIPATGPVLLACNHVSFGDPPLVGSAIDRTIHFLARESLFRNPLFGAWLRSLNSLPVDRDGSGGAGLRAVLELLSRDELLLIFPEGTRSPDGQLQAGRPGSGLIAMKSGAPVVPVRVFGLYEAWGRHRRFPGPGKVKIKFGHPLVFREADFQRPGEGRVPAKVFYQQVADNIMAAIGALTPSEDRDVFP